VTNTYYNVAPRYTAGSPALVDYTTAMQVAKEEARAYPHCLDGTYGPELQARAKELGLHGIVESRTNYAHHYLAEDLITGRRYDSRDLDPRKPGRLVRLKGSLTFLKGLRARVVAVSKRTDGLTVALVDAPVDKPAWKVGDTLNVAPHDVAVILEDRS
jgi:hypothetical protein